ncbi:MAG: HAMP domain-containing histidine kinase [Faecalibacterium sp.]|nr:HAMP domain-containing histidine kinase [Ruminococcus sp.]MCM1391620.1 HAMP domain-containing histidine kinase [Ruminococcus sp.]MCM1484918.1 HAMP domain-containing histidine kinase [Faecalibacterium sp.]
MSKLQIKKRLSSVRSSYITAIAVFSVFIAVLTVLQFFFMDNIYAYSAKKTMITAAEEITQMERESDTFRRTIADCEARNNIYVEIYKPRDVLVYTTASNEWIYSESSSNSDFKPRIMKVLDHRDINSSEYFEIRQEYFASAKYIVYSKTYIENDSSIVIYYSSDVINANARTGSWTLFSISMLLLIGFITITLLYTFTFVIPIDKINAITRKITQMEFDESCPPFKIRELDELSDSVNALSASLDLTLKDLNIKNRRLEQDIEKERVLEETRKQFIASASHELKTPISIIQGYAEGIKFGITDGSPEEYCDIIIEESQKMNSLVMRMLEVTRYDNGGYSLDCSPFPIAETLSSFASSRIKSMNEKGITFSIDIDPSYYGYADKQMIADVFANYLSNAVSHADFEKIIKVTCKQVEDNYRVSVFNTGKQIADEDISRIWQSFYRADKSRSRAEGRFGLGLSIVVAAQDMHARKYGVINHENGVEFWFDIASYIIPSQD